MVTIAFTKASLYLVYNWFGKLPTKWFEGDETILILFGARLLKHGDDFLLLQSLAEGHENVLELRVEHGAVGLLVVQLQDLHEVLIGAAVLVLLDLGVDG